MQKCKKKNERRGKETVQAYVNVNKTKDATHVPKNVAKRTRAMQTPATESCGRKRDGEGRWDDYMGEGRERGREEKMSVPALHMDGVGGDRSERGRGWRPIPHLTISQPILN